MSPVSVLVADDHQVVLLGVAALFKARPDIEVVAIAHNGEEALERALEKRPDVVCADYKMPGSLDGFDLVRRLRSELPSTNVVLYTGVIEFRLAKHAMEAGATAVVSKDDRNNHLIQATLMAAQGRPFTSPAFAAQADSSEFKELSTRQMAVLRHMADGLDTKDMAERMHLSEETVRHHVKEVLRRLGASSRTHAVSIGLRNALLS